MRIYELPLLDESRCTGCGDCVVICPVIWEDSQWSRDSEPSTFDIPCSIFDISKAIAKPSRASFRNAGGYFVRGLPLKTREGFSKLVTGMEDDTLGIGYRLAVAHHFRAQVVVVRFPVL